MRESEKMMAKIVHVRTMDRAKHQIENASDILSGLVRDSNDKKLNKKLRECIAVLSKAMDILDDDDIHSATVDGKKYIFGFNNKDVLMINATGSKNNQ